MGSFNTSCFASMQTISSDNPVRVGLVFQSQSYEPIDLVFDGEDMKLPGLAASTSYCNAFWRPMSPLIRATYYDYGRVNLHEDDLWLAEIILRGLVSNSAETKQGENQYHDVAFDGNEVIKLLNEKNIEEAWEYVWNAAVHEGRVFATGVGYPSRELAPVSFMIMHDHAFQELKAITEQQVPWRGKLGDMAHRKYVTKILEESLIDGDGLYRFDQNFRIGRHEGLVGAFSITNYIIYDIIKALCDLRDSFSKIDGPPDTTNSLEKIKNASIDRIVTLTEDRWAMNALDTMNIKIAPVVYASQDYSNEVGDAYAAFVSRVNKKVTAGQRERYGNEEDDESGEGSEHEE